MFGTEIFSCVSVQSQSLQTCSICRAFAYKLKRKTGSMGLGFRFVVMLQAGFYLQVKTWASAPLILTSNAILLV